MTRGKVPKIYLALTFAPVKNKTCSVEEGANSQIHFFQEMFSEGHVGKANNKEMFSMYIHEVLLNT